MKQLETDVVVAAGLSGLAASVAAAESGARVITLEKASNTGGAANMGMGPAAAGSPVQKASMIEVTPGELFRRHMFYTHYQVDARLVRAYYFKSGDTIAWLQDMGVEFNSVRPAFRAASALAPTPMASTPGMWSSPRTAPSPARERRPR